MPVKVVGIAGISGKFARCILDNLLKDPLVSIRGYCRDPTKLPDAVQSSSRVQITKGESTDNASLHSFVKGCDVVICCYLGDNSLMIDGQKALVDACEAEGVPRYIASDYALDFRKLEYGQLPAKDPMKHIQEYIESKPNVTGVHVLIGAFMDTLFSPYFQFFDPQTRTFSYWGTGRETWEATSYANASEFVAAVALDENAVGFQRFLGDRKSIIEIAAIFEEVYGEGVTLKQLGTLEDLYNHMHQIRNQDPNNIFAYLAMFYQYYCTNGQTHFANDMEASGYPNVTPLTFRDFFKQHSIDGLAGVNSG